MSDQVKNDVLAMMDEMIALRRDFHQYPELGMEEVRTAGVIADYLNGIGGIEVKTGIAKTGVAGLLEGAKPGKTVLLRADIDALTIQENKDNRPYASKIDGMMHACGHDGHTAILLTAAKILSKRKQDFSGTVKFMFQPGEEGFGGARIMIEEGILENPKVDAAFALHLVTSMPVGAVGTRKGSTMACGDWFNLKIIGKAGHAGSPHQGADAILMSAHVVTALQGLIGKEKDPLTPLILHIGKIKGGDARNIVAETVELQGTVRTFDEVLRRSMPDRMNRMVKGITASMRGTHELEYVFGYPSVVNDPAMTDLVTETAKTVVDNDGVVEIAPMMPSDDMAFILEKVPGCYFYVGAGNPDKGIDLPHHNPGFDIDEDALCIGAEMMVKTALEYLSR